MSPKEVENAICGLDGVAEAVVIGVPDAVLGQAVKAVVTAKESSGLTSEDVRRHCVQQLEDFMVPKVVELRGSIPRMESGKVDRKRLGAVTG